jgi:hypothetical protein
MRRRTTILVYITTLNTTMMILSGRRYTSGVEEGGGGHCDCSNRRNGISVADPSSYPAAILREGLGDPTP